MPYINLEEYLSVKDFLQEHSYRFKSTSQTAEAQFQLHELIGSMMDYLLIKDSIENGTGNKLLDRMMGVLLHTKPATFFEKGYLADLFVIDRISVNSDSSPKFIQCKTQYLSTLGLKGNTNTDDSQFMVFKMTA